MGNPFEPATESKWSPEANLLLSLAGARNEKRLWSLGIGVWVQ
jgi:hypothetical protein